MGPLSTVCVSHCQRGGRLYQALREESTFWRERERKKRKAVAVSASKETAKLPRAPDAASARLLSA